MANKTFQKILKNDIRNLIGSASATSDIGHAGLLGGTREFGLNALLTKYLPFGWEIGSGQIHDSKGNQSSETDLIICNRNILPPIMYGDTIGFYPLESCAYAIEVKSKSTATEIKSSIEKFRKLKQLVNISGANEIHCAYFAYASDLTDEKELERYKKYDPEFYTNPAINIFCIIGQGYWFYKRALTENGGFIGHWTFNDVQPDNYEVGVFVSGIINTINVGKPAFGHYFLEHGGLKIVDQKIIEKTS